MAGLLRVLIVDDERMARDRLARLLSDEPGVAVVGSVASAEAAIEAAARQPIDLVLLDIEMPGLSGFEFLERLGSKAPAFAFVTAHDEHAIRAFDVAAADYLLKPVTPARLSTTLARARARLAGSPVLPEAIVAALSALRGPVLDGPRYLRRLTLRQDGVRSFLDLADVEYIEAARNYVWVWVQPQRKHLLRTALTDLERRLDPAHFARAHRTTLVNLARVKEVQPWFSGDLMIVTRAGAKVKLSRSYKDDFLERLATGG